ncbi:NAD(P)H-binding protein [Streptomyces platensis]|uniref:NAD(P)H-binding protein n=1 Tax=Streptomyces platensis TaxID=58346 RepID=UPI002ED251CA|nr:NAD(P)H-binding protein [Streptomyces platensis]
MPLREPADSDLPIFWVQLTDPELQQIAAVARRYHYDRGHFDQHWAKVRAAPPSSCEPLDSARQAGVEHVVLVSSITVQTHPHLGPAGAKLAVEKLLKNSGMAWTILRPTQFASNALWWAASIREHGAVRAPYADIGLPTIHPADIASVARVALTETGHHGRTYALTGPERVTARQQVESITKALGREVPIAEISREEARLHMVTFLGDESADAVLDVTGGDVNEELLRVRDTVEQVTGSPARSFRQWVSENASAFC